MECKNCHTLLNTEQRYCFECGAKVIKNRLTFKNLSADFGEQFLSYDNKFLITYIDLFRKPDKVIYGYIKGTRKKYINVIQYLAISLTLLGLQLFILNKFYPDFFAAVFADMDKSLEMYPEENREKFEEFMTKYYSFINEYQSLVYVLGIPLTAFVSYLAFFKEKLLNFVEHIVLNTYITAQYVVSSFLIYLLFAVLKMDINIVVSVSFILYLFYYGVVFYKIFKLSVAAIILRFLLSLAIVGTIFLILMILGIIVGIVYMKFFK